MSSIKPGLHNETPPFQKKNKTNPRITGTAATPRLVDTLEDAVPCREFKVAAELS